MKNCFRTLPSPPLTPPPPSSFSTDSPSFFSPVVYPKSRFSASSPIPSTPPSRTVELDKYYDKPLPPLPDGIISGSHSHLIKAVMADPARFFHSGASDHPTTFETSRAATHDPDRPATPCPESFSHPVPPRKRTSSHGTIPEDGAEPDEQRQSITSDLFSSPQTVLIHRPQPGNVNGSAGPHFTTAHTFTAAPLTPQRRTSSASTSAYALIPAAADDDDTSISSPVPRHTRMASGGKAWWSALADPDHEHHDSGARRRASTSDMAKLAVAMSKADGGGGAGRRTERVAFAAKLMQRALQILLEE